MYFLAYQDLFSCISKEYTWNKHKYHFQIQHTANKAYPKPAHGPQLKKNLRDLRGTGQLVSFLCCLLQSPSTWLLVGWIEHLSPGPWQQNPLHKHMSLVNIRLWMAAIETCSASGFYFTQNHFSLLWGLALILLRCGYSDMVAFPTHPVPTWVGRAWLLVL